MGKKIKAITFDLWDTIIDDDSDEVSRGRLGLKKKIEERYHSILDAVTKYNNISPEELKVGYDVVNAAFEKSWKDNSITWTAHERIEILLTGLSCSIPKQELDELVDLHCRMEIEVPPNTIPGITKIIPQLAAEFKLCIISDTIITPGNRLRELLEFHNLKKYFSGFAFSDEVGHSKPHPAIFQSASDQLEIKLEQMVHIGDREHNDVKGSQSMGMKAILFTAKRDDDKEITSADAVCQGYTDLPKILKTLDR